MMLEESKIKNQIKNRKQQSEDYIEINHSCQPYKSSYSDCFSFMQISFCNFYNFLRAQNFLYSNWPKNFMETLFILSFFALYKLWTNNWNQHDAIKNKRMHHQWERLEWVDRAESKPGRNIAHAQGNIRTRTSHRLVVWSGRELLGERCHGCQISPLLLIIFNCIECSLMNKLFKLIFLITLINPLNLSTKINRKTIDNLTSFSIQKCFCP